MTGFVSIINPPVEDPEAPSEGEIVEADAWFTGLDLGDMRKELRIDDTVTSIRLRYAVRAAMVTVMNDLLAWQGDQIFAGHESLEAVPAAQVDGESRMVIAWRRAVYCFAKAELIERYRDIDTTASGEKKLDGLDPAIVELRRDGSHAIRDILGRLRTTVELI